MIQLGIEKTSARDRSIAEELSPRDLLFLKNLGKYGLTILEVKVSPISPVIGLPVTELPLPEKAMAINVIKGNQSYFPSDDLILDNGDIVYFLTSQIVEDFVKEVFIPPEYK